MFSEIALREPEVGKSGIGFLQLVVHPIDCPGFVFDSSSCLRVILHDFSGADLLIDIDLPKDYLFVFCGSQGVAFNCFINQLFLEMLPKETNEIGIGGYRFLHKLEGDKVHINRICRSGIVRGEQDWVGFRFREYRLGNFGLRRSVLRRFRFRVFRFRWGRI